MTISGITLTLHPFDAFTTSTFNDEPIVFNTDPFYIEDGSVDISEPEKETVITAPKGHSVMSSRGVNYGTRQVSAVIGIKNYEDSLVQLLFRYINNIDYLSDFVKHPLGSLEVNLGTNNTSGATYRGYLKILSINISPSTDIYEVGPAYNQDSLGQRHNITFICDPFFYKYKPTDNQYQSLNIYYPNATGTGWLQGTSAKITPSNYPCFYIVPSDIEGDVASPLIVRVTNPSSNSHTAGTIYVGTNLVKTYPNVASGDNQGYNQFWEYYWDSAGENLRTVSSTGSGALLDYKLAGKVYSILIKPSVGNIPAGSYVMGIMFNVVSEVDVNTLTVTGSNNIADLGMYYIPNPGRNLNVYRTRLLDYPVAANETDYEILTMPAWNFRKYVPKGYNLPPGEILTDNSYSDEILTNNGGIHYHGSGSGLYAVPGVGLRGALVARRSLVNTTLFDEQLYLGLGYNPRYLNIRNII